MSKPAQAMRAAYNEYARQQGFRVVWTYKVFAQYAKRHPLWALNYAAPVTTHQPSTMRRIPPQTQTTIETRRRSPPANNQGE